jgi:UDP-glucose 4-epimerase
MTEEHQLAPASPYGRTKLAVEFMIHDYAQAYKMRYVILRYFNAAGALPEAHLGENHVPETHIIPLLLRAIRNGERFTVYGRDYATPDGTCIRDYVHVKDIAEAHAKAYAYLMAHGTNQIFNLGTGNGYSVTEIIEAAQAVCKRSAHIEFAPRRPGDVPILVADPRKAERLLHWNPIESDLAEILSSVYLWEQDHRHPAERIDGQMSKPKREQQVLL